MAPLKTGDAGPDFCLIDQDKKKTCLRDLRGQWIVLYFYPKDNTPGCTLEALQFTAKRDQFKAVNTVILGISPDSVASHCNFIERHELTVRLLSDESYEVLGAYGAWGEKKKVGKTFFGVMRSTFLINPEGRIQAIWKPVEVKGHADAVLEAVKKHQS